VKGLPFKYWRRAIAKTGAGPDRRSSFNFYRFKEAVEDQVSASKGADQMSLENGQETGIEQLVRQFREQQYDADLQPPTILTPTKPAQLTDQELDELTGQLKKLRLSAVELAKMVASMPFLNRIHEDANRYTQLLKRAAAQPTYQVSRPGKQVVSSGPPRGEAGTAPATYTPLKQHQQPHQKVQGDARVTNILQRQQERQPTTVQNVRLGDVRLRDYTQVRSRPTDKTTEARKGSELTFRNRQGMTSCSSYWARMQGYAI